MESCDRPDVVFTFVDPNLYGLNYILELTDEEQSILEAERADDVAVLLMLWKDDDSARDQKRGLNANVAGPVLINVETGIGIQKIIANPKVVLSVRN